MNEGFELVDFGENGSLSHGVKHSLQYIEVSERADRSVFVRTELNRQNSYPKIVI